MSKKKPQAINYPRYRDGGNELRICPKCLCGRWFVLNYPPTDHARYCRTCNTRMRLATPEERAQGIAVVENAAEARRALHG